MDLSAEEKVQKKKKRMTEKKKVEAEERKCGKERQRAKIGNGHIITTDGSRVCEVDIKPDDYLD